MSDEQTEKPLEKSARFDVKRLWPIAVIAAGLALFYLSGANDYLSYDTLRENRAWLLEQVENHAVAAAIVYFLVYAVSVAFSLPGGALLTVIGGFLFGQLLGVTYVVSAATSGATALFLIAKTTIGDAIAARMGSWMKRMEKGFQENAFNYLLVMRLIPLFPFWAVNLVPAFLGVPLRTYFLATVIGIIPGTVVYIQVGAGLGSILESGEDFTLAGALTTDIKLALAGLAVLSLLPILYKAIRRKRST